MIAKKIELFYRALSFYSFLGRGGEQMEFKYSWTIPFSSEFVIDSHQKNVRRLAVLKAIVDVNQEKLKEYKHNIKSRKEKKR